ncbi:hypothetical protein [Clostridium taeniosporum]|uniref:Lipoprotein n=1 Tax=Clostridium taeniosporum TaxID=394958 RepID=A0A1D7XMS6_9CLOT|nr:hypothetical protein [Clostridium taeniosporum]AOR24632.1 hypothetical protein BGI42_13175 [Clostridium taeniosporum]
MKLKKTLSVVMAATLSMFTIAGCSSDAMSYSKEVNNLAKWEAVSSQFTGEVNVEAQGESKKLTFTGTSYNKGQDQVYVDFKFNDPSGEINIPELKAYIDKGVTYMNKSYYVDTFTGNGQSAPEALVNLPYEYIAIDSGMDMKAITEIAKSPDYLDNLGKMIFGDSNIGLPLVKNGREYSINMNSDEMIDLFSKAAKAMANNLDSSNSGLNLGFDAEKIKEIQTAIKDPSFDTTLNQAKTLIQGSTLSTKATFTDNDYKSEMNINLQVKDMAKVNIKINATSVKAEGKDIEIPASKTILKQDELMKLMTPQDVNDDATAA